MLLPLPNALRWAKLSYHFVVLGGIADIHLIFYDYPQSFPLNNINLVVTPTEEGAQVILQTTNYQLQTINSLLIQTIK